MRKILIPIIGQIIMKVSMEMIFLQMQNYDSGRFL